MIVSLLYKIQLCTEIVHKSALLYRHFFLNLQHFQSDRPHPRWINIGFRTRPGEQKSFLCFVNDLSSNRIDWQHDDRFRVLFTFFSIPRPKNRKQKTKTPRTHTKGRIGTQNTLAAFRIWIANWTSAFLWITFWKTVGCVSSDFPSMTRKLGTVWLSLSGRNPNPWKRFLSAFRWCVFRFVFQSNLADFINFWPRKPFSRLVD